MKFFVYLILLCIPATVVFAQPTLLQPEHLVYLGAFRLPDGSGGSDWGYSGHAMAYNPYGDANGAEDGYPGSLFGVGHAWQMYVSEISIPVPILSPSKNVEDLNTAETLIPFTDVRAGIGQLNVLQEIVRVGIAVIHPQFPQTDSKLYLSWGAHFQEDDQNVPSHMWCDLDLTNPAGAWRVAGVSLYSVNDYMFEIPPDWAYRFTGLAQLATGRFRDGGWSGMGPCLYATAPWKHGNPPADRDTISAIKLLQYSTTYAEETSDHRMNEYHNSDEWTGGAWLTAGDYSAVVFVGTKGVGDSAWYGNSLGPCLTCDERGWWSDEFRGQILFYSPADLAMVASGMIEPWEPQPYAVLDIDDVLYSVDSANMKYHTGACAFDRTRNILYMFEPTADEDKSIVHAWKVDPEVVGVHALPAPEKLQLRIFPHPVTTTATLEYTLPQSGAVTVTVSDILGREVLRPENALFRNTGSHTVALSTSNLSRGLYFVRILQNGRTVNTTLLKR